jgi:hypothetical protein
MYLKLATVYAIRWISVAADIPRALPIGKKIICTPSEKDFLEGTDKAWEQYKKGKGTRVTSTDELNALLDSL